MGTPKLRVYQDDNVINVKLREKMWYDIHITYVDEFGNEFPLVAVDNFYSELADEAVDHSQHDATVYLQLGDDDNPRLFHWSRPGKEDI